MKIQTKENLQNLVINQKIQMKFNNINRVKNIILINNNKIYNKIKFKKKKNNKNIIMKLNNKLIIIKFNKNQKQKKNLKSYHHNKLIVKVNKK